MGMQQLSLLSSVLTPDRGGPLYILKASQALDPRVLHWYILVATNVTLYLEWTDMHACSFAVKVFLMGGKELNRMLL